MTLDIALPAPVSQTPAAGGPPGAGPPTPTNAARVFAALMAQQNSPPAGRSIHAGPNANDNPQDDTSRETHTDKGGNKDAADNRADPSLFLVSMQPLPPEAIALAPSVVLPGPPVPLAPTPLTAANAANTTTNTTEAMDTSLTSAPAPRGGADLLSGGGLLPQTAQASASLEEHAPAVFPQPFAAASPLSAQSAGSLPPALSSASGEPSQALSLPAEASVSAITFPAKPSVSMTASAPDALVSATTSAPGALVSTTAPALSTPVPALGQDASLSASAKTLPAGEAGASGLPLVGTAAAVPDPSAAASTKLALQGYAQFGQTSLQIGQTASQIGQTALQNSARPANNASIGKSAPAISGTASAGKSAGQTFASQSMTTPFATALPDAQAMPDWAQAPFAEDDEAKDKRNKGGEEVSGTALMPTAPGAGETKPAAAPAAPMALADRAALMQQAEGSLHALHAQVLGQGRGQMTLQLHPQDWGKLQVSVTMTPDAKGSGGTVVTAHVVADSAAVKQALETGNADLRRTLREAGLHLERFTVTVRPAEAGSEAQSLGSGSGGNGRQQPQDAQSWTTPGSQGSSTGSASAGNGGNTFGGGANSGAHTPAQTQTTLSARSATNEQEMQAAPALSGTNLAARLDTRA